LSDYSVPDFVLPDSKAKGATAKRNKILSKVLAFIELNKCRRFNDIATIMPIPQTNKKYMDICGSKMGVGRLIHFMTDIGLIRLYDSNYHFSKDKKKSCSRKYVYYVENEKKIIDYCNELGIVPFIPPKIQFNKHQSCDIIGINKSDIVFSSSLKLVKPVFMGKIAFEKELTNVLFDNYTDLLKYSELAQKINSYQFYKWHKEFQIQYFPSFKWDKKNTGCHHIHKIGIRATNSMCNVSNNTLSISNSKSRQSVLDSCGLNLSYDINSSVPRLTLSLHSGYWINKEECADIYSIILNKYNDRMCV